MSDAVCDGDGLTTLLHAERFVQMARIVKLDGGYAGFGPKGELGSHMGSPLLSRLRHRQ